MNERDDSADARLTAARHYLATIPLVEEWTEQLAVHLSGAIPRERIGTLLEAHREHIEATHVALMVKHHTAAEIEALAQFQASPVGRAIMRKQGAFQAELIPALSPLLRGVIDAELRARGERR